MVAETSGGGRLSLLSSNRRPGRFDHGPRGASHQGWPFHSRKYGPCLQNVQQQKEIPSPGGMGRLSPPHVTGIYLGQEHTRRGTRRTLKWNNARNANWLSTAIRNRVPGLFAQKTKWKKKRPPFSPVPFTTSSNRSVRQLQGSLKHRFLHTRRSIPGKRVHAANEHLRCFLCKGSMASLSHSLNNVIRRHIVVPHHNVIRHQNVIPAKGIQSKRRSHHKDLSTRDRRALPIQSPRLLPIS